MNLKPLTPSFFLPDVHKVVVPDCDSSDAKSLKRRLRFLQNLLQNLRKLFGQDISGCIGESRRPASKK
jgi:hypothetical protein